MAAQIPSPDGMAFPEMQHANATYPVQSYNASTAHYDYRPPSSQSEIRQDRMKQNPLESLELDELDIHVKALFEKEFKDKKSVTEEELIIGARLARSNYANHERDPGSDPDQVGPTKFTPSIDTVKWVLNEHDWKSIEIQRSKKFWQEPKALLVTLAVCCLAPWVQGWDQAANGNLVWPEKFGVEPSIVKSGSHDAWEFGTVNAVLWFGAMAGPLLFDPICNANPRLGRRGSVLIAAGCSLAGSIGGSRSTSWQGLLGWRVVLGIGIGAKASIVPIWESEILPPAKRGRVLVSWQTFIAIGLLTGSGATYVFRHPDHWRYQIMSGALPALVLLVFVYVGCESPRWLIVQERYLKAFDTLVELRKERLLAAEEFCYTYFQIQMERNLARKGTTPNFEVYQHPIRYTERLKGLFGLVRNRRALIATTIVMTAPHLTGINIFAILGTNFFDVTKLDALKDEGTRTDNNLKLGIGFATATVVSSAVAYFLVEPLPVDTSLNDLYPVDPTTHQAFGIRKTKNQQKRLRELQRLLRGRRRLLLISLASGTVMLGSLTGLLTLPKENPHKAGAVAAFVFFLAMCYSPGVGAVPFLYSAEIWPNEARDIGMSVGVLVNFFGAGMLTLVVPLALAWSPVKLFVIFTSLSTLGFFLVYFFVPCTNEAVSLEEMSAIFENSLFRHAKNQVKDVLPFRLLRKKEKEPTPLYPAPMAQYPPSAYTAPLPGQQQFYYPNQQYAPYGYPPQHMVYEGLPIPQPYYNVGGENSPHGSFSLSPQQSFGGAGYMEQPYSASQNVQHHPQDFNGQH